MAQTTRHTALTSARQLFAAFLLLATPSAAQSALFVIDATNSAGTDYTNVDDAVAAVPVGSTLLVRAGTYAIVNPITKGLDLIADPNAAAPPRLANALPDLAIECHSVGLGDRLLLRGFELGSIEFTDMEGRVWVEDCDVAGAAISLRIHACPSVTLRGCRIGSIHDTLGNPSLPLYVTGGSTVQVFDVQTRALGGGPSGNCFHWPGVDVRHASTFYAADSRFAGSDCGHGPLGGSSPGLRGRESATLRLRNTVAIAGDGSPQAQDIELVSGATLFELADVERALHIASPLPAGVPASIELAGAPFERAFIAWAETPGELYLEQHFSVLTLGAPWQTGFAVMLDAQGQGSFALAPALPPGLPAWTVFLQPAFLAAGEAALGAPSVATVLAN